MNIDNYFDPSDFYKDDDKSWSLNPDTRKIVLNLFDGEQILSVTKGSYQGECGAIHKLPNDKFAVVTDYFGSCSVCDRGLGCNSNEEIKNLVTSVAHNAHIEDSLEDIYEYIKEESPEKYRYNDVREEMVNKLEDMI